jgi:cyclophilin family peptidyl-prolyl cis-trans isomerase/HEAT repeat protein
MDTKATKALLAAGLAAALGLGVSARQADDAARHQAVLAAEDARAPTQASLQTLLEAARDAGDPGLQAVAVRALGRLERPGLVPDLVPLLDAAQAEVRAQAANAVGQAVSAATGRPVDAARHALEARLKSEENARVLGVVAATLGRLPYSNGADARRAESDLIAASWAGKDVSASAANQRTAFGTPVIGVTIGLGGRKADAPPAALVGVADGLRALIRRSAKIYKPSDAAIKRLRELVLNPVADVDAGVRIRRLALQALANARDAGDDVVEAALRDEDPQVRRIAVLAAASSVSGDALAGYLSRGLADDEPMVRLEALRAYGRLLRSARGCGVLVSAVSDVNPHVKLEAIDQLGGGCADPAPAVAALEAQADAIGDAGTRFWHAPAHAIVSLARLAPGAAKTRLDRFVTSRVWQVRMYAARAAAALGDEAALRTLAGDANPNVRDAAVEGLHRTAGHAADDVYLAALESDDIQLVRSAARALDGTPTPARAMPALLEALARLTRERHDTSRDARTAILDTVRAIGTAADAPALWTYLADFDPSVSSLAASTLTAWIGIVHAPLTTRIDTGQAPSWKDAEALVGARARFIMAGGGAFEIALHPSVAPANVLRFVRLARAGYYDGLTFHRIVPNFVVQGGSPHANEYSGDASFTRDELGLLSNVRGAVGVSTRGRDTGDGQIYIDLVDNPRLDHEYTVFADVVRGMDTVDNLLEGATIQRVEIVP